jgi:hypothetical protein
MSSFEQVRRKLSKCLGIYVADTGRCGLGIFAAKPFPAGAALMTDQDGDYYRDVVSYQELRRRGYDLDITLQVGFDAFKLPNGSLDDSPTTPAIRIRASASPVAARSSSRCATSRRTRSSPTTTRPISTTPTSACAACAEPPSAAA